MGSPPATDHCVMVPVVMMTLSLRSIAIITTGILCSYARKIGLFSTFFEIRHNRFHF